jgi:hypothetical protein
MLESERNVCLRLLRDVAGHQVEIVRTESLGGNWAPVERLVLAGRGVSSQGEQSVIVKTRRHGETGWGGDPLNLVAEHSALVALESTGLMLAPRLLAWDETKGVLVMSDLAPARAVGDLLQEDNPTAAESALIAIASTAGTMQATTTATSGGSWNSDFVFARFPERLGTVFAVARTLAFPDPEALTIDVDPLIRALEDPNWHTFTHADLTPNNALIAGDRAFVIDFEGAGLRHCMIDGAMFSLSFPQYGYWAALPERVIEQMENAYRWSLATGLPRANDDGAYGIALATGCAAWTMVRLARLETIADPRQDPEVALRRRSQIVHTIASCMRVLANTGAYPALHDWLDEVASEMRRRWPEARMEPRGFPAFAGG